MRELQEPGEGCGDESVWGKSVRLLVWFVFVVVFEDKYQKLQI